MSYDPNQILGTFLPDGNRLTGIICTSIFQGRMVFTPDGCEDGRLIASINGRNVGLAEQLSAETEMVRYTVYLHPSIMGSAERLELKPDGGVYVLKLHP